MSKHVDDASSEANAAFAESFISDFLVKVTQADIEEAFQAGRHANSSQLERELERILARDTVRNEEEARRRLQEQLIGIGLAAASAVWISLSMAVDTIARSILANRLQEWALRNVGTTMDALRTRTARALAEGIRQLIRAGTALENWASALRKLLDHSGSLFQDLLEATEDALHQGRTQGSFIGAELAGVRYKRWITVPDDRACDTCLANENAGEIRLHVEFPSGLLAPPAHPRCRCELAYR